MGCSESGGRQRSWLLDPATLRRRASLRTCQYVNVLAFVALRLTLRRFRNAQVLQVCQMQ